MRVDLELAGKLALLMETVWGEVTRTRKRTKLAHLWTSLGLADSLARLLATVWLVLARTTQSGDLQLRVSLRLANLLALLIEAFW